MDLKQRLAEKRFGFYVTLAVAVLSLVTAIVYAVGYSNNARFMSWPAFILLIVGAVAALVFAFLDLDDFGTAILALFSLIGLLLFIHIIYNYVVVVMIGIDLSSFSGAFIASAVMFVLTFAASFVNLFLPQKKNKEEA